MSWTWSDTLDSPAKPLPSNPYDPSFTPEWHNAYRQCLQIQPSCSDDKNKFLVYARILGYLMLKAPTPEGRDYLSQEILRCGGYIAELHELAELIVSGVLTLFRNSCCSPESEPTEQLRCEFFYRPAGPVERIPRDHGSAKLAALNRDGYRCMVTRTYDWDYFVFNPAEGKEEVSPTRLYAWHIIPPLSATERASTFIINFFALSPKELRELPHSLDNTLTLACNLYRTIHELHVWFEDDPTTKDTYFIRSWSPRYLRGLPSKITFSSKTNLPLPNPVYFKMHAAICEVAHLSGESERKFYLTYLEDKKESEKFQ